MRTLGCHRGNEFGLDGAVHPVAGVAESWDDVALVVEVIIEGCGVDGDIGVVLVESCDAFGGGDEADHSNICCAGFFEHIDSG